MAGGAAAEQSRGSTWALGAPDPHLGVGCPNLLPLRLVAAALHCDTAYCGTAFAVPVLGRSTQAFCSKRLRSALPSARRAAELQDLQELKREAWRIGRRSVRQRSTDKRLVLLGGGEGRQTGKREQ